MAFDTFLKIEGVDGESQAKGHEKEIELFSFSWGASNPVTVGHGAGMAGGKVSISSFNVMKKTDVASPTLFKTCCSGKHFTKATVTMRKATGEGGQDSFLIYNFEEVFVESIQWSGSAGGDETPTESLSLAFGKVTIEYKTQGKDGKLKAGTPVGWDIEHSVAV